jgi:hypothetical protein
MSRTYRTQRGKRHRDGKPIFYKCRCDWCINIPWRDRHQLTIKEDLEL